MFNQYFWSLIQKALHIDVASIGGGQDVSKVAWAGEGLHLEKQQRHQQSKSKLAVPGPRLRWMDGWMDGMVRKGGSAMTVLNVRQGMDKVWRDID